MGVLYLSFGVVAFVHLHTPDSYLETLWSVQHQYIAVLEDLFNSFRFCRTSRAPRWAVSNLHPSFYIARLTPYRHNPITNAPQLSEAAILSHAKYLSEDIGYRSVGTREHALGDAWTLQKAEELKKLCEKAVVRETGRKLECEHKPICRRSANWTTSYTQAQTPEKHVRLSSAY